LQVWIQVDENGVVYEQERINVTHRLLPRETWTRMVRVDVREFATSTITITLLEDDDGDGTYTVERDRWTRAVRVYPERGFSDVVEDDTGLLGQFFDPPLEAPRRPADIGF
jgi:hypothetical protein